MKEKVNEIDQLKSGVIDPELIESIRKFEYEEYPEDAVEQHIPSLLVDDDDLLDSDYDINYDSDENYFETIINDEKNNVSSPDNEDILNLLSNRNLTKIGKETTRRTVRSRSNT